MKRSTITLLVTLLLGNFLFGQTSKDSLLRVIKKYKINDTIQCNRIVAYIELEEDTDSWMKYNDKLFIMITEKLKTKISKSEIKKYNYYLGQYYNNRGFYFAEMKKYDISLANYKKAEAIFKKIKDLQSLALIYQNLGTHYDEIGETLKVLPYYNEVLKIRIQTHDSLGLAYIYSDLGRVYSENGSDEKGLDFFTKSMKISEKLKDEILTNRTRRYMYVVLANQKEWNEALKLVKKDINYCIKVNDKRQLSMTYINMATVYLELKQFELMKIYNDLGLKIGLQNNYFNQVSIACTNNRNYYTKINNADSVFKYAKLEYEYGALSITEPYFTEKKLNLSKAYALKKDIKNAKVLGLEAYKRANELKYPELIMNSAKNLKEIFSTNGEKIKALEYAEVEIKMKDSLFKVSNKNSAIKSLFKYETEKKEAKINELNQKKKITELESNKKTILINSFIVSFIALAIMVYFLFSRFKTKKKNELLQNKLAEAEKLLEADKKAAESELKALKSQMNPHFIFNSLNSIQMQFMYGDKLVANEQLNNFTYLTRQILEISSKKQISIANEVEILTKYLELERLRFSKDFDYSISVSQKIDEDYHKIPPMIIQPFVENCLKHGLMHKKGAKKIQVFFAINLPETVITCTVIDNGIGRDKSAQINAKNHPEHHSFSTQSIEQRLGLLNSTQQLKKLIDYSDVLDEQNQISGTQVVINIPIA